MESKLKQLQQMVAEEFAQASENPQSREQIDKLAKMKVLADDAMEEAEKSLAEKSDILKAYSAAVAHQSFNDPVTKPVDQIGGVAVSFEDALQQFLEKK